jgi:PleD family two-component response regulator
LSSIIIVVLEDDLTQIRTLRRVLDSAKMSYKIAADGNEFLEILPSVPPPDIAILDINCPVKDGFEVLTAIRANRAYDYLVCVMFSMSSEPDDMDKATRLGADGYEIKPPEAKFPETIARILKEHEQTRKEFTKPGTLPLLLVKTEAVTKDRNWMGDIDSLLDEI